MDLSLVSENIVKEYEYIKEFIHEKTDIKAQDILDFLTKNMIYQELSLEIEMVCFLMSNK